VGRSELRSDGVDNFRILGHYPGLAIIFFLLAAGGGLALMLTILLKDE
jgi:hypothetical protein